MQIGQLRSSDIGESWGKTIALQAGTMVTNPSFDKKDGIITLTSGEKFSSNEAYYIECKVMKTTNSQTIALKLINDAIDSNYIQLGMLNIPAKANDNDKTETVRLCFKPTSGSYSKLLFFLYSEGKEGSNLESTINGYTVSNLITSTISTETFGSIVQLGVQAKPGFKFVIDGEEIEVGRTGIYELPVEPYSIDYFGVINKNKDNFIIDYKFEEGGQ